MFSLNQIPSSLLTEELILEVVAQDPEAVRHLSEEQQTEKVCWKAINTNAIASFQFIKNPTEEMILAAVEARIYNFSFVKNPSKDLFLKVLKIFIRKGESISWLFSIDNTSNIKTTTEILQLAIPFYPKLIARRDVTSHQKTYEVCKAALEIDGTLWDSVPAEHKTEDLAIIALQTSKSVFYTISNRTERLIDAALNRWPSILLDLSPTRITKDRLVRYLPSLSECDSIKVRSLVGLSDFSRDEDVLQALVACSSEFYEEAIENAETPSQVESLKQTLTIFHPEDFRLIENPSDELCKLWLKTVAQNDEVWKKYATDAISEVLFKNICRIDDKSVKLSEQTGIKIASVLEEVLKNL